nr:MAG TPA_asm: hypothetical protein [Caudoviricetes sp.]
MAKNTKITGSANIREFVLAVCLVAFGCVLLSFGFAVNPTGVIDVSVLTAFGEICTLAGAILGYNYAAQKKFDKVKSDLYREMLNKEEDEDTDR